jgi:hypothetical protein
MVRAQPFGDRHRKRKLTERRQAVLDFVGEYGERHGYPPSLREIGSEVQRTERARDVVPIRGPLPDQSGFPAANDDLESSAPAASYGGDLLATSHAERQLRSEPRIIAYLELCTSGVV